MFVPESGARGICCIMDCDVICCICCCIGCCIMGGPAKDTGSVWTSAHVRKPGSAWTSDVRTLDQPGHLQMSRLIKTIGRGFINLIHIAARPPPRRSGLESAGHRYANQEKDARGLLQGWQVDVHLGLSCSGLASVHYRSLMPTMNL